MLDVNEPPQIVHSSAQISVYEDVTIGQLIGTLTAVDPEGDLITFVSNSSRHVSVSSSGRLYLTQTLDYEASMQHTFSIEMHTTRHVVTSNVTLTVMDVDESPVFVNNENDIIGVVNENEAPVVVATIGVYDPEGGSLSVTSLTPAFNISENLQLTSLVPQNYETTKEIAIRILATDNSGQNTTLDAIVSVTDRADPPYVRKVAPSMLNVSMPESAESGDECGPILTHFFVDEDTDVNMTFVIQPGSECFVVNNASGRVMSTCTQLGRPSEELHIYAVDNTGLLSQSSLRVRTHFTAANYVRYMIACVIMCR